MKSNRSLGFIAVMTLFGCAEVGQVLNTAMTQATTPPVFYEGFEAPITINYTIYRAGQFFTTQQHTWQVTAASIDELPVRPEQRDRRGGRPGAGGAIGTAPLLRADLQHGAPTSFNGL